MEEGMGGSVGVGQIERRRRRRSFGREESRRVSGIRRGLRELRQSRMRQISRR